MTARKSSVILHSINNRLMVLSIEAEFLERSDDADVRSRAQRMRQIVEQIGLELRELTPSNLSP